jgi:SPP1 gp7 family putative phage head morphogenesis protein
MLSKEKALALAAKATVDWQMVGDDWEKYLDEAGENWREAFIPVIRGVITARGEQLTAQFGMQFDIQNLLARDWFNNYMLQFAQDINLTTKESIATILAQAQEEGWAIPTMQSHLSDTFEQWMTGDLTPEEFTWFADRMPPYRTEMIARTETLRASNSSSEEIYREWGSPQKEWLSTQDDRTRPDHIEADGQIVGIDESFSVGGEALQYPGDPNASPDQTVNCRCTVLPVIPE